MKLGKLNEMYPVIGMSPGNSYFKEDVVRELLKKVVEKFGRTTILIADVPAISTYMAFGYPKNRAWRDKALPQGNNLRNKVQKAMNELGYTTEQVSIINWKDEIENNLEYKKEYQKIFSLYKENEVFQKSVDDTTQEVLENSDKEIDDLSSAIRVAAHYLLSEIGFMEFSPKFLNSKKIIYIYHKEWPIYEKYILGVFDGQKREYLDFEIIK
ncbi:MAG: tRNA-dependent cyclodipeptide synthase [Parcubacteria group bacterium]